ncbi:MAG: hypothetical protein ACTHJ5_13445 [Ilyomonas sp.]
MYKRKHPFILFAIILFAYGSNVKAQTEHDAIMLNKSQWCNGFTYMYSQWDNYWEGTFKRNNLNMGTVSTQSVMYMTNYGITNKLNIMGGLPYVWTKASGGTLHGLHGFQDASVYLKWKLVSTQVGNGKISLFAVGGISTPVSNYVIDFLPLSIGLGSTNLTGRALVDYQVKSFFVTLGGAYVWRSNVKLDRTSYYTTEQHITNEVKMPDMATFNFSAGVRKKYLVAEALVTNMTTLGGFDIRKNDMPFPSNKMNSTVVGAHIKYTLPSYSHLEFVADANYVIKGRNVGQGTTLSGGVYYIFSFKHK